MGEILGRVMTVAGSQITVNPEAEIGRAPDPANRPRSDQTTHREGRPQSRRPNPEPATSCYYWSWRGLHRSTTPGSFGFQHPETTPPLIPTTLDGTILNNDHLLLPSRYSTLSACGCRLTRLNRFTCVTACPSLCLRLAHVVTSISPRLDFR